LGSNIKVQLNEDFFSNQESNRPHLGTLYTGPLDRYFKYVLGRLPWRSLRFEFESHPARNKQSVGQINFPDTSLHTRKVEFCHIEQCFGDETVISTEYPSPEGDPYYPIPSPDSTHRFNLYRALAQAETKDKRVFFEGRLANYTYINTDQAIALGLKVAAKMLNDDRIM
jgi:UDP-galactopyranose mutase